MASQVSKQARQCQGADKLCWTCEKKVQAERSRTPWSVADLLMVALTAGLWVPIRMMYQAVTSPWRCVECGDRIEAWHKSLGRAATYGFGGFIAIWLLVPGLIAVVSDQPREGKTAEHSTEAIAKEKARRDAATAELHANRDQIVSEIRSFISTGSFGKAEKRAEPYLFLGDSELNELHGHAQRKARESRLLASVDRAAETDIDRRMNLYGELARLDPNDSAYQRKHAQYAEKVETRDRKAAAAKAAAERKKRLQDALERVGMAHRMKHYPAQLSGGQQQRVAVARAVVGDPSILLADEPTGNLDSSNGEAVMSLLKELHEAGSTICMVTHDPRYARHAERSIHLFDGRVVEEEDAAA